MTRVEALSVLEDMAERWEETEVWHNPPFHDGQIHVRTKHLHAAYVLLRTTSAPVSYTTMLGEVVQAIRKHFKGTTLNGAEARIVSQCIDVVKLLIEGSPKNKPALSLGELKPGTGCAMPRLEDMGAKVVPTARHLLGVIRAMCESDASDREVRQSVLAATKELVKHDEDVDAAGKIEET